MTRHARQIRIGAPDADWARYRTEPAPPADYADVAAEQTQNGRKTVENQTKTARNPADSR